MFYNIVERYKALDRLSNVFENDPELQGSFLNSLTKAYNERERVLFSQGYAIAPRIQQLGPFSPEYLAEANQIVTAYNQKFPDNPLPTNEELQRSLLINLHDTQGVDLSVNNLGEYLAQFFAGAAVQTYDFSIKHPIISALALVGGGLLTNGLTTTVGIPLFLSAVTANGVLGGALALYEKEVKSSVLQNVAPEVKAELGLDEEPDTILTAAEGAFGGATAAVVFAGAAKTIGSAVKLGRYTTRISKRYSDIYSRQLDNLSSLAKNATPLERAEIVDLIKMQEPSSIYTQAEKTLLISDMRDFLNSSADNNMVHAQEVLDVESPLPRMTEESIQISNELAQPLEGQVPTYLDITAVDSIYESVQESFDSFNRNFSKEASNETGTTTSNIPESNGTAGVGTVQSAGTSATTTPNTAEQYIVRNFPKSKTFELNESFTGPLRRAINNIEEGGIEFKPEGYVAADIKNFNAAQTELALRFNLALNNAIFNEVVLISTINALNKKLFRATPAWYRPENIHTALSHIIDSTVETYNNKGIKAIETISQNIIDAITAYSKQAGVMPDTIGIIDAITKKNSNTKYLGIVNSINEGFNTLNNLLIEAGVEPMFEPGNFSNVWDSNKFSQVPKEQFITDGLNNFDFGQMNAIANKRGRALPIDQKEFLSNMYDSVRASNTETRERIVILNDGAAWLRMHEKYGSVSTYAEAIEFNFFSAKNRIVKAQMGLTSLQSVQNTVNATYSAALNAIEGSFDISVADRNNFKKQLVSMLYKDHGLLYGKDGVIVSLLRLSRKVMLATASISAFFADRLAAIPSMAKTLGTNYSTTFKLIASTVGDSTNNRILRNVYNITSDYNRRLSKQARDTRAVSLNQKLRKNVANLGNYIWDLPETTLNAVASKSEQLSGQLFGSQLAEISNMSWAKLPGTLKEFLGDVGIQEKEWNIYRQLPNFILDETTPLKSTNYINDLYEMKDPGLLNIMEKAGISAADLRFALTKFRLAETQAINRGSPRTTILGRTLRPKEYHNPLMQIWAYVQFPFTGITYVANRVFIQNTLNFLRNQQYGDVATTAGLALSASALTWYTRQLLKGNPNPEVNERAITTIISNSGLLSIEAEAFAELIMGEASVFSNDSYRLPLTTTFLHAPYRRFVKGKDVNWYKTLSREFRQLNPVSNVGMLGMLFNKYTINSVFRLLDPEGARAADEELYRRYQKGEITKLQYELLRPPSQN